MTQQNAALVEEAAAAAQSLQDQASELAKVVSVFKLHTGERTQQIIAPVAQAPVRRVEPVAIKTKTRSNQVKSLPAARTAPKKAAAANSADEWEEF